MKKITLLLFLSAAFFQGQAQDTTMQQYAGSYYFEVAEMKATVTIDKGVLNMTFPAGTGVMKRIALDTFLLISNRGEQRIEFRRDEAKKIVMARLYINEDLALDAKKEN